ncbi:hypothetical protein [Amphiplicatus metriothermophilus]|uniref:Lipoprotein n=1 Tax=Amphiplicatus metriothermophilus TaxID=1519374 RepID=A0A239PJZ5_9PROT|nr:hypothetical protein [Amphiplicatus metriothermophilus]MBB5517796.1 flagellar motility protein MotE (MotC chaperone) [Amphiplicatus metriothermophilus]SNT67870.1 hypothetical protein SAMN06297382_0363 [Amphiplicatus metriothermophilus]
MSRLFLISAGLMFAGAAAGCAALGAAGNVVEGAVGATGDMIEGAADAATESDEERMKKDWKRAKKNRKQAEEAREAERS